MNVGKLRHRVDIYRYDEIEEVGGSNTLKTLTLLNTVWGEIEAVKGLVSFDTKQIGEEVTHKVIVRYYPNLNTEFWLGLNDRRFRIRFVRNIDERNQYHEMLVEEKSLDVSYFQANINAVGDPLQE